MKKESAALIRYDDLTKVMFRALLKHNISKEKKNSLLLHSLFTTCKLGKGVRGEVRRISLYLRPAVKIDK